MKAGQTKIDVGVRAKIVGFTGEDAIYNGLIEVVTHPFADGCTDKGWVGLRLNTRIVYGDRLNVRESEIKVIEVLQPVSSKDYFQGQITLLKDELAFEKRENKKLKDENESIKKFLETLTPGGSEFHNDPVRCFSVIKEQIQAPARTLGERIKDQKKMIEELILALRKAMTNGGDFGYDKESRKDLNFIDEVMNKANKYL